MLFAHLSVFLLAASLAVLLVFMRRLRRAQASAEAALRQVRQSERFFSESFHASPTPLALTNLVTNRITETNAAFIRLIGEPRHDLVGRTAVALGMPNGAEREKLVRRLRRSGIVRDFTTTLTRRDGAVRNIVLGLDLIEIDDQPHALHTIFDQTDHRRAVAELRQTDERMRELAKAIDDVFHICSPDRMTLHYVSPAYETIWGRTLASVYANPLTARDAVVDEDHARVDAHRAIDLSGDEFRVLEFRIARPDGTIRWIRTKEFPVRDASGTVIRIAGVSTDVTEQRFLEEQLRQAQKMESLGMLAGGIAHDFNNLLAVISSCSGLLAETIEPTNPDHELVEDISGAVVRASALTRQLLAFSRKHVVEPIVLDANTVVTDTRKLLRRIVGDHIDVITSLDPELHPIRMDRGQLVQVILNLAVNARDAMMPNGGTLQLVSRNGGEGIILEVIDSGTGMPADIVSRACEPFFTTKEQGRGTGMGLAVVHGIVDQAGGRIELHSKPGHGTTVRIALPAYEGQTQALRVACDADERGVETVLIVDDDDYVRRATARALRARGYTVVEASGGRAALSALPTTKFDLMLTDVMMPGMNGRVLAEVARTRFPDLRVMFMTGYTDDEIVRVGVECGEVEMIEKPFTIPALAAKVRSVLDDTPPMPRRATGRASLTLVR